MIRSTRAQLLPIGDRIERVSRRVESLRSGFVALVCGAALLAACESPAWGAAVEPDHPHSAPGMGNGGHPVDPGFKETPPRPMPMCVTAGCTVIDGPGLPAKSDGERGGDLAASRSSHGAQGRGGKRLHGCPPGDPTHCKPL